MSLQTFFTAATYHSRSARSLLNILCQSLSESRRKLPSPNPILLFTFAPSPTTTPETLSDIISTLTQFCPEHVGCISAPLPSQCFDSGIHGSGPNLCSFAYAFINAHSFRSTISGRAEAQVGRWHAARQRTKSTNGPIEAHSEVSQMHILGDFSVSNKVNWEDVWNRPASSVSRQHLQALPDALQKLDPLTIDNILYFSDKPPEELATILEEAFPQANKLSLIASSTPFITGRPVTLFHNGSILSDGAVGIAFSSPPLSSSPVVELSLPPLVTLSPNLTVTSSEGNLILSLDRGNPTKLLLAAIQKHDFPSLHTTYVGKEDNFFVGVIDSSGQQVSQLHRIVAGDPSRGTIALDCASAPRKGSIVRLYYLPSDHIEDTQTYVPDMTPNISLFVAPEMTLEKLEDEDDIGMNDSHSVISGAFHVASENGFTLSSGGRGSWKCVVPRAHTRLTWTK